MSLDAVNKESGRWPAVKSVLVVESNTDELLVVENAFRQMFLRNAVHFVPNEQGMIAYMEGKQEYSDRVKFPYPCAIILDLKEPEIGGVEALTWLRASELHRTVPLIVIGKPENVVALRTAVSLGASAYMTKPFQTADFRRLAQTLHLAVEFSGQASRPRSFNRTCRPD